MKKGVSVYPAFGTRVERIASPCAFGWQVDVGKLPNTTAGDRDIVLYSIAHLFTNAELSQKLSRWERKGLQKGVCEVRRQAADTRVREYGKTHVVFALPAAEPGRCDACNVDRLFAPRRDDSPRTNDERVP